MNAPATQQNNPFADQPAPQQGVSALADSEQGRSIAEVQSAMVIAKRFPRNQMEAADRILQACTRPTLARGALYSYPKGGQVVTGPSIRLAEALAQNWGNLQFGIRELEQRNGESVVEAFAWDVETNTRQVKIFTVPHSRYTKANGNTPLTDPREIYEHVANNGARRLRACILGVIPGDVIEEAVKQSEATLRANVDITPEGLEKTLKAFSKYGVTKEMIESRILARMSAIRPAQVVHLTSVYQSLKDGMSAPQDWFDMSATEILTPTAITETAGKATTETGATEASTTINEEQQRLITNAAEAGGKTIEDLCKAFEVASIAELKISDLDGVFDWAGA